MRRPVKYPNRHLVFPPSFCGGVGMYATAWSAGSYSIDWATPFDKRLKSSHRFSIADTHGRLDLTVPVSKPGSSRCRWDEIAVSTHGGWWDVHRVALESAYGRTPYFEFYIDRFLPMLTHGAVDRYPLIKDLSMVWEREISDILGLALRETATDGDAPDEAFTVTGADVPSPVTEAELPPYRQVRDDRLGFITGLSVLDLIFNLGPESQLYLNEVCNKLYK